jgi:hypothetical protein
MVRGDSLIRDDGVSVSVEADVGKIIENVMQLTVNVLIYSELQLFAGVGGGVLSPSPPPGGVRG